jgi:regulator of sigma E protease
MLIVFVHELGHFLTARMFGVRVKEFMIGLPGPSIGFTRNETRYGVTCIPLGGYARIAGMEGGEENPNLDRALSYIAYFGRITLADAQKSSERLGFNLEDALDVLDEWGTIVRKKDREHIFVYEMPRQYVAPLKQIKKAKKKSSINGALTSDATLHDIKGTPLVTKTDVCQINLNNNVENNPSLHAAQDLKSVVAYEQGEPRPVPDAKAAIDAERNHTYRKLKWWQRMVVLAGGAGFNLLFAIIILTAVIMFVGQNEITSRVDKVALGSPAAEAGISQGDTLVSINDIEQSDWLTFSASMRAFSVGDTIEVGYIHDGEYKQTSIKLISGAEGKAIMGVEVAIQRRDVAVLDAISASVGYVGIVAQAIVQLLNPTTFQETIAQSSSVVGVSVEAQKAAESGFLPFISLTALLSISIGLMNLLPIPPLDGGKVVVETIQRILRRAVPVRIVNYISMTGMALLLLLFFVCTSQDIQRYFLGS